MVAIPSSSVLDFGPARLDIRMQPRPIAETRGPFLPSVLISIAIFLSDLQTSSPLRYRLWCVQGRLDRKRPDWLPILQRLPVVASGSGGVVDISLRSTLVVSLRG